MGVNWQNRTPCKDIVIKISVSLGKSVSLSFLSLSSICWKYLVPFSTLNLCILIFFRYL